MGKIEVSLDTAGVTDVPGFELAGVACDIRNKGNDRLDLAILFSARPCTAAGTFTRNAVRAAPVRVCQHHLEEADSFHGIIANSGNANACTGEPGHADAVEMAGLAAKACGVSADSFLVCSTGRIGEPLPMEKIRTGISKAASVKDSSAESGKNAAWAILTSDTRPKTVTARFEHNGKTVTVAGMAKGAGMIQPNMATMLAFVATDLGVSRRLLSDTLSRAVSGSFNAITVDGDMSTNDTVLLLANGASGLTLSDSAGDTDLADKFFEAVSAVCQTLAEKIVSDGEKITKVVELKVSGALNDSDAEKVARAIGNSLLVKSSWYGEDPNWGRLADAAGYAGAELDETKLDIHYGDVPAVICGLPKTENKPHWKEIVKAKRFTIRVNLNLGPGTFRLLATDLTEGYVNFNKSE